MRYIRFDKSPGSPVPRFEIEINLEDTTTMSNIVKGPHMYSDECDCCSCYDWRSMLTAGMHLDVETVMQEANLLRNRAGLEWSQNFHRGECEDPLMQLPCSVVLALCRSAGIEEASDSYQRLFEMNEKLEKTIADFKKGTSIFAPVEHNVTATDLTVSPGVRIYESATKGSYIDGEIDGVVYVPRADSMLIDFTVACDCGDCICGTIDPHGEYNQYYVRCTSCRQDYIAWDKE